MRCLAAWLVGTVYLNVVIACNDKRRPAGGGV